MLTRYALRADDLYSRVLGEPCILTTILSHLRPKDAVSLLMSKGAFTEDARFRDAMGVYLREARCVHEACKAEKAHAKRVRTFLNKMSDLLMDMEEAQGMENRKRKSVELFDLCLEHKDIVNSPPFTQFKKTLYYKLIELLVRFQERFQHEALYYLGEIFDVRVRAERVPNTEDEYVEFIEDLEDGRRIWMTAI